MRYMSKIVVQTKCNLLILLSILILIILSSQIVCFCLDVSVDELSLPEKWYVKLVIQLIN